MIKRTLAFESAGTLRLRLGQLLWRGEDGREASIPVEDIGFLVLESPLVMISAAALEKLGEAGAAVIICGASHLPAAYSIPAEAHTLMQKLLRQQIAATVAAKARLWRQIVAAKILNQAACIRPYDASLANRIALMAKRVRKDDSDNQEAQAALAYFGHFAARCPGFRRQREGAPPNPALNYGYAILRGAVARALVSSGLNCALGLHHRNQYNAFCLADDVMEPYRPFVDRLVLAELPAYMDSGLSPGVKRRLLGVLASDAPIGGETRPLMIALAQTSASLARAFCGEDGALSLPAMK